MNATRSRWIARQAVVHGGASLCKRGLMEAAMLAGGGDIPHFYLIADLPTLKRHDDGLRMPWTTAKGKPAVLDLAQ